jgi:hypothetical protein
MSVSIASSRRLLPLATALLILLTTAAMTGCTSSKQTGGASGATTPTAGGPTPTAGGPASTAGGPATSEPVGLADGRHPGYLKAVDPDGKTITFDLIQYLTGDAATRAAAEDGEESPPPNDYYIRNVNPRLRTLPVRADASITVNALAAQSTGSATKDVPVTLAKLATWFPSTGTPLFWITVEQGQVAKLAEQYLP